MTVFPDDNKKYLSTDLLRDEPLRGGFVSPDVKLLGFGSLKRVCLTCGYGELQMALHIAEVSS